MLRPSAGSRRASSRVSPEVPGGIDDKGRDGGRERERYNSVDVQAHWTIPSVIALKNSVYPHGEATCTKGTRLWRRNPAFRSAGEHTRIGSTTQSTEPHQGHSR